jgi:hypothetical protein
MKGAGVARDYCSNLSGWLLARVADYRLAIFPLFKEVWQLIVASTLPKRRGNVSRPYGKKKNGCGFKSRLPAQK